MALCLCPADWRGRVETVVCVSSMSFVDGAPVKSLEICGPSLVFILSPRLSE